MRVSQPDLGFRRGCSRQRWAELARSWRLPRLLARISSPETSHLHCPAGWQAPRSWMPSARSSPPCRYPLSPSLLKSPKKSSPSGTAEDEIDTSCWGSNVPSPLARLTDNTVVKFGVSAMTKSGTPSLFRSTASVLVTSVKFCVISGWVWVEKLIGVWAEAIVDKPASSKTGPRTLEDRDTGGTPPELLILRVLSTWQRLVAWLSII